MKTQRALSHHTITFARASRCGLGCALSQSVLNHRHQCVYIIVATVTVIENHGSSIDNLCTGHVQMMGLWGVWVPSSLQNRVPEQRLLQLPSMPAPEGCRQPQGPSILSAAPALLQIRWLRYLPQHGQPSMPEQSGSVKAGKDGGASLVGVEVGSNMDWHLLQHLIQQPRSS